MEKKIIQVKEVVDKIGKITFLKTNTTIFLLNIENMYPSIKYSVVKKAVNFFSKKLQLEERTKIKKSTNDQVLYE